MFVRKTVYLWAHHTVHRYKAILFPRAIWPSSLPEQECQQLTSIRLVSYMLAISKLLTVSIIISITIIVLGLLLYITFLLFYLIVLIQTEL